MNTKLPWPGVLIRHSFLRESVRVVRVIRGLILVALALLRVDSPAADGNGEAFFESKIRPLLVERCIECHGVDKQKGGLRLDSRAGWQAGGESGPVIVAGKPAESRLITAVGYTDKDLQMPPKKQGGKLGPAEIAVLVEWVAMGAPDPRGTEARSGRVASAKAKAWWAFQPVKNPVPPKLKSRRWAPTPLDQFILAGLEAKGLKPAPAADKRVLIRRATFDLTGLPPTPQDVEKFAADQAPDAYPQLIDRLLASPQYGQHWARHWLDVVRYADYHDADLSVRNNICDPLEAWRYRDWVVESFNRDFPFDQFIVHQIAGDLLPSPTGGEIYPAGLIATGFLANGVWDRGDADKEKMVSDMVDDNIDTVGKAFLGLTLGCARCHDHKFDPITNEDYYALAGVFYSSHFLENLGTKGGDYTLKRVPLVPRAVAAPRDEQVRQLDAIKAKLTALDLMKPKPADNDPERIRLVKERDQMQSDLLPPYPVAMTVQEGGTPGGLFPKIQDVPVHLRGSYTRMGPVIPRRMPAFFAGESQPPINQGSGRRELAAWVASKENPLTARVIVNRVWQWHFGDGLVHTPNNFGLLSEPPTHPALLDWLALRFIEDGWSLKQLHRRIMLSATYQQASAVPRPQLTRDPDNHWLGRFSPRRLEAEAIRDAMIFATGRFDPKPDGPAGADLGTARRSLYVQTTRFDRSNFSTLFDAANPDASVEKRTISTVAPQSLLLLNHEFVRGQAALLAKRLLREAPGDEAGRIHWICQVLFARPARAKDLEIGHQLLAQSGQPGEAAAWRDFAHVLLCTNEFIYVD